MRFIVQPFYIRLREAYDVAGTDPTNLGAGGDDEDENMNNAWFDGVPGSTSFRVREAMEGEGVFGQGEDQEMVEIEVTDAAGRKRKGVFPCWRRSWGKERLGLGNPAFSQVDGREDGDGELREYEKERKGGEEEKNWKGFPHDPEGCPNCQARLRVKRQLEREEAAEREKERGIREREALFASVGLSMGQPMDEDEDSSSVYSYDTELDELEPPAEAYTTPDGVTYPALPRTHDRSKLAHGSCDGVREVYVVGGTDGRHRDAWGEYEFYGRVREWDGLIGVVRKPKGNDEVERGYLFFYGYLVGGENWVGNWRFTDAHGAVVGYEGAFVMGRRMD